MPSSRAIVVLGMHRNGTSLLTRGLQSLGVALGEDFLATQFDNPTGYWEDRQIVAIHERLLQAYGLKWESVSIITDEQWQAPIVNTLRAEAGAYLRSHFCHHPLWGFKDPRTIRLLPFWVPVFAEQDVDDQYVVVIRNPVSVASSLFLRQQMDALTSHLLWLLYMVLYLDRIAQRPFVVVDYDLLMEDPPGQLERIALRLSIPLEPSTKEGIADFSRNFLDPNLRHNISAPDDFDNAPHAGRLTREAYLWFRMLATDKLETDSPRFWTALEKIRRSTEPLVPTFSRDES